MSCEYNLFILNTEIPIMADVDSKRNLLTTCYDIVVDVFKHFFNIILSPFIKINYTTSSCNVMLYNIDSFR